MNRGLNDDLSRILTFVTVQVYQSLVTPSLVTLVQMCREYDVPEPEWSASEHDVTVTFWRIGKDQPIKEGALGGENVENSGENQLSERQVLICNMLKVNGENSARSLARILNLSQRTVEREISFLRNHGFIDKDGTKNGVWKVLK